MTETTGKQAFGINELIGKVFILYGKAKAIAPDGTEWVLAVNSPVFAMERIVTDSDGGVCIMMEGPPPTLIDIGRMSDVVLDEDVSGGGGAEDVADASAEAETVQAVFQGEGGWCAGCARHGRGGAERGGRKWMRRH